MITFTDLKPLIARCCQTSQTSEFSERFGFSVNTSKLEQEISQLNKENDSDFHVLAFQKTVVSRYPTIMDIQMLVEYFHNRKDFDTLFDGKTQIATLMLYSKKGLSDNQKNLPASEQQEIDFAFFNDNTSEDITDEEMFKACNSASFDKETGEYTFNYFYFDMIKNILSNLPIYMIVIYKQFNTKKEKFEYNITIRSGYRMVGYHKYTQTNNSATEKIISDSEQHDKSKCQKATKSHDDGLSSSLKTKVEKAMPKEE